MSVKGLAIGLNNFARKGTISICSDLHENLLSDSITGKNEYGVAQCLLLSNIDCSADASPNNILICNDKVTMYGSPNMYLCNASAENAAQGYNIIALNDNTQSCLDGRMWHKCFKL